MKLELFSTRSFAYSLSPGWRKSSFLVAIALPSLLIAFNAIRIGIASTLGESNQALELLRAVALDSANAEFQHRLGLIYSYSPEELNPAEGLRYLRRATELNPYEASYWAELASACDSMGDLGCVDQALERALARSPMTPRFQWLSANHYLLTHRPDAAMMHLRRLLELSPQYASVTFDLSLRLLDDPEVIYQKVLPAGNDPALKLEYADFLLARHRADFAQQVWVRTVANASPFPFSLAEPYVERLLNLGRYQEALRVWSDLERLAIVVKRDEARDNLVFNGSFEQTPLNAGFDWHYGTIPYLLVDFSDARAYRGLRCLRLDFTVEQNEEYEPVSEIVPVVPRQEYLLTAHTRSESITSDSGPRLRVLDPICPICLNVSSEPTTGTTPWHAVSLQFSTGAETRFVRLSIWRPRSRSFPTQISGTFWLDAVTLRSLTQQGIPPRAAIQRISLRDGAISAAEGSHLQTRKKSKQKPVL